MNPKILSYIEHACMCPQFAWKPGEFEPFIVYIDRISKVLSPNKEPHFKAHELLLMRRAGIKAPEPPKSLWMNIIPALWIAEEMRAEMGPLLIGNGYRPKDLNKKVGGARFSTHIDFRALDLDLPNIHDIGKRRTFYEFAGHMYVVHGTVLKMGVGFYSPSGGTRVHIDAGRSWGRPACWEPKYAKAILASIR